MAAQLVQYIVLRSDLRRELKWTIGALVAQACHATAAVNHMYRDDENVKEYLADMDNMHKIVLEVSDEESLKSLAQTLSQENLLHKLWIEQPENYPTCLVTKPYPKSQVQPFLRKLKLYKD